MPDDVLRVTPPGIATATLVEIVWDWRKDPSVPVTCPACAAVGLAIADRSARPYREWYALSCRSCGFEKTIGLALAAPIPGT